LDGRVSGEAGLEGYARRSARVFLADRLGRFLFLESTWEESPRPTFRVSWFPPGGGVEPGESLSEAAVRELREEVGLDLDPASLGPVVAFTAGTADLGFAAGRFRDDFFFVRVERHEVDVRGLQAGERDRVTGHRWWSVEELRQPPATVVPFGAAGLLQDLLAGRVPATPVQLPWHLA
jgi:8-oxo-dGTP pyrophosphatase MutT (NUDIX family)